MHERRGDRDDGGNVPLHFRLPRSVRGIPSRVSMAPAVTGA
jgi:hypothetical protein